MYRCTLIPYIMDKVQLYATVFDAACFLLSNMNLYDQFEMNLDEFRKSLRCIIEQSATARVLAVEEMLNLSKKQ